MKFHETHFEDYIKSNIKQPIHQHLQISDKFSDLDNLIIYGPPGVGKYTQALSIIKQYSSKKCTAPP